jgi:hypothetical protein
MVFFIVTTVRAPNLTPVSKDVNNICAEHYQSLEIALTNVG